MREIKFRAWDKQTKRLFQVQTLQFYGTNNTVDACWTNGVDFDGESTLGEPELNNLHNLVLMQYTGMKDINGVEIYEGDILKIINGMAVVDFDYATLYHIEHHPVEVIGNIYQNQDLLEVEQQDGKK